jgi:hypothetical protein
MMTSLTIRFKLFKNNFISDAALCQRFGNKYTRIFKTVVLLVVLYGCETWSLTLREEHRLKVFGNRMLKIFGPTKEEDGSWRTLHNDELHSLYSSPNNVRVIKLRRMRWAGHVALMGEGRGVYRVLIGRPEGNRPLGRPRHRWEDNIKMDLGKQGSMGRTGFSWFRIGSIGGLV